MPVPSHAVTTDTVRRQTPATARPRPARRPAATWIGRHAKYGAGQLIVPALVLALLVLAGGCPGQTGSNMQPNEVLTNLWVVGQQGDGQSDDQGGDGTDTGAGGNSAGTGDTGGGANEDGSGTEDEGPQLTAAQRLLVGGVVSLITGTVNAELAAAQMDGAVVNIFAEAQSPTEAIAKIDTALATALATTEDVEALVAAERDLGGWITDSATRGALYSAARIAMEQRVKFALFSGKFGGRAEEVLCSENEANTASTVVVYVNGLATPRVVYSAAVEVLRSLVSQALSSAVVKGMYQNATAAAEREAFGGTICPSHLVAYPLLAELFAAACESGTALDIDLASANSATLDSFFGLADPSPFGQAGELANMIDTELLSGKKVILVAYSQGGFFAQQALANIKSRADGGAYSATTEEVLGAIGVVWIGSPLPEETNTISANSVFVSVCEDEVARLRDGTGTGCVDSPVADSGASGWFDHHSIELAYLDSAGQPWEAIKAGLQTLDDTLTTPFENAGQGVIQVTLTWASEGDVDLYVDEPNGDRVYYGDKVGPVGTLDVDNTYAYGPENYFVCSYDELEAGEYDVGVNYYRGGPAFKAGVRIQEFTGSLTDPNYGANIIPVATITVTADGLLYISD